MFFMNAPFLFNNIPYDIKLLVLINAKYDLVIKVISSFKVPDFPEISHQKNLFSIKNQEINHLKYLSNFIYSKQFKLLLARFDHTH